MYSKSIISFLTGASRSKEHTDLNPGNAVSPITTHSELKGVSKCMEMFPFLLFTTDGCDALTAKHRPDGGTLSRSAADFESRPLLQLQEQIARDFGVCFWIAPHEGQAGTGVVLHRCWRGTGGRNGKYSSQHSWPDPPASAACRCFARMNSRTQRRR
jgi:hypothetical protein